MRAGENGRIAIFWNQTDIDGLEAAPLSFLEIGASWSWRGQARFLVETTEQSQEWTGQSHGASASTLEFCARISDLADEAKSLLVLTNGAQTYTAALFSVVGQAVPMLVFEGSCPERDQEFWISDIAENTSKTDGLALAEDTVVAFPSRQDPDTSSPDSHFAKKAGIGAD